MDPKTAVFVICTLKHSDSSVPRRKIECARRFFSRIGPDQVRYDVVDGYDKLLALVQ